MKAIIETNNKSLFNSLVQFLKSINVFVKTEDVPSAKKSEQKKSGGELFNPKEYEGILSPLNLDTEKELLNMKRAWKRNS